MAGQIDFSCGSIGTMLSLIKAGKLRALLVTTPTRNKDLPDVPTANQLGLERMEQIIGWSGIDAPLGTPKAVLDKLTEAIASLDKNANWRAATELMGSVPYIKVNRDAEQFAKQQYETYFNLGKRLDLVDKIN
jgi:tripartite-type tricarboxylate transporter receptor subunit TctC